MLLYYVLLFGSLLVTVGPSTIPQHVTANASLQEFSQGFLHWADTLPKGQRDIRLGMPALDVYSRTGKLLYHGQDAVSNATFLRNFPSSLVGAHLTAPRPPLKMIVEMFPEFRREEPMLLRQGQYTVVAYSYIGWNVARPQDNALKDLRRRAPQIRVLEVRITPP